MILIFQFTYQIFLIKPKYKNCLEIQKFLIQYWSVLNKKKVTN